VSNLRLKAMLDATKTERTYIFIRMVSVFNNLDSEETEKRN